MVTGDMKITARAIAKECGIIKAGDEECLVLEGVEFMDKVIFHYNYFCFFKKAIKIYDFFFIIFINIDWRGCL